MTVIRSRILQYIPESVQKDLRRICTDKTISDNNEKATLIHALLTKSGIDFVELGPGTNRYAVLIEGYVFKIAMDKWGQIDNVNEFSTSHELQPYVVKTYELSDDHVLTVCEYVTVISREEFIEQREVLHDILSILAESYLLGDVGTVPKNFTNWGYRDNGDLVILDYAYIYRIVGNELLCTEDQTILEYDEDFHKMYCPTCRAHSAGRKGTYSFMDLRRRISAKQEEADQQEALEDSYKLTSPKQDFKEEDEVYTEAKEASLNTNKNSSHIPEEETNMKREDFYNKREEETESQEDIYLQALEAMKKQNQVVPSVDLPEEIIDVLEQDQTTVKTNILDVESESDKGRTHVRVITQEPVSSEPVVIDGNVVETIGEKALDALAEAQDVFEKVTTEDVTTLEGEAQDVIETVTEPSDETKEVQEPVEDAVAHIVDDLTDEEEQEIADRLESGESDEDDKYASIADADEEGSEESDEGSYGDTSGYFSKYANDIDGVKDIQESDSEVLHGEVIEVRDTPKQDGVVISEHEVKISDKVSIKNTITVDTSVDEDDLRNSLLEDDEAEDRVQQLAEQYAHLEDDEDQPRRNRQRGWE